MPIDPSSETEVTAFRWVPDFAAGVARDLRRRQVIEKCVLADQPAVFAQHQPEGEAA